jgi:ribosomal protein S27AE
MIPARVIWSFLNATTILCGSSIIGLAAANVVNVWAGVVVGWSVAWLSSLVLFLRAYPSRLRPWRNFAATSVLFLPIAICVLAWYAEDRERWPAARKTCPRCTERAERDAAICAHCGYVFEPRLTAEARSDGERGRERF